MYETGTTGIKNFDINILLLRENLLFLIKTLSIFNFIKTIRDSSNLRGTQSGTLIQIRDTLLPKLISGKLRIPDAEKMIEEVGV